MYERILIFLFGMLIGMTIGISSSANAQVVCTTREKVVASLDKQYSEKPVSIGLASNGSVIEVFASPTRDTWTIILTRPNGTSCVMAVGEAWEDVLRKGGGI